MSYSHNFEPSQNPDIINIKTNNPQSKRLKKLKSKKRRTKHCPRGKENINPHNSQQPPSEQTEVYQSTPASSKLEAGFVPRILKYSLQIDNVSCGESHIAFITDCGHLYMRGDNSYGKLGLGYTDPSEIALPSLVESLSDYEIKQVSCGANHTGCVTKAGKVFLWGQNKYGALGNDYGQDAPHPQLVDYISQYKIKAQKVSCGWYHTCILSTKGDVFLTGFLQQQSDQTFSLIHVPEKCVDVSCGEKEVLLLTKSGFVYSIDLTNPDMMRPVKVKDLETEFIIKIDCNQYCAAITDEKVLYIWGESFLGNFKKPERIECIPKSVLDVSLGTSVSACIDSSGLIWTWGENTNGELGVGDFQPKSTPFPVMALQRKNVTKISCGGSFYIAIGKPIIKRKNTRNKASNISNTEFIKTDGKLIKEDSGIQIQSNYVEDTLEPFRCRKSSTKLELEIEKLQTQNIQLLSKARETPDPIDYQQLPFAREVNLPGYPEHQRMVTVNDCQIQTEKGSKTEESEITSFKNMNEVLVKNTMISEKSNMAIQTDIEGMIQTEFSIFNKQRTQSLLDETQNENTTQMMNRSLNVSNIEEKDSVIESYEQTISYLSNQVKDLQKEVSKVKTMRNDLTELESQRNQEQQENIQVISDLKLKLEQSQAQNMLLRTEFDNYKELKEEEIAGLKIDKTTLQTEYEEYKNDYNEFTMSVQELRAALGKLKSDYKLLSLENSTLQDVLAKEKDLNKKNFDMRSSQREEVAGSDQRVRASYINPYESLPVDNCPHLDYEDNTKNYRYSSVKRKNMRGPYTPSTLLEIDVNNVDRKRYRGDTLSPSQSSHNVKLNFGDEINLDSQSPILYYSFPKSGKENENGRTSHSQVPWIQTPF
ncbi:unnamed protein product [Moneuplotes crassus]|uniref:RCC1-like domain-containing protein n=1 Tax=Euplotes crassus TaxID=5936 RepID=A0AAD1XXH6_EUPCR|nr:unnamed protein product [Moneuplotes crassus]